MESMIWRILGYGSLIGLAWCLAALVRQFRGHAKIPALLALASGVPLALLSAAITMYIVYYRITGESIRQLGKSVAVPTLELAVLSVGALVFSLALSWPVGRYVFRKKAGSLPLLSAVVIVLLYAFYFGFRMVIGDDVAAILA